MELAGQEAIALIASFAGVGAFLGAAAAMALGRDPGEGLVTGTVGGGLYGVIARIERVSSGA